MRSPGDEAVRSHEQAAMILDLAYARPFAANVVVILAHADAESLDRDAQLARDLRCSAQPILPADPGDDRERSLARQIDGRYALTISFEPYMREISTGVGRGVVIQLRVARIFGEWSAITHHRTGVVVLAQFDADRVELTLLDVQ